MTHLDASSKRDRRRWTYLDAIFADHRLPRRIWTRAVLVVGPQ